MTGDDGEAEFQILSQLVAEKKASPEELTRWRALRKTLSRAPVKPPPIPNNKIDSRKDVRTSRKLRVGYSAAREMPVTFTDEVGAGGLRLTLQQPADVGALFAVRLELAGPGDPEAPLVLAKVVWCKRDGNRFAIGLEFVGLKPEDRERIEAWAHAGQAPAQPPK
jgi:hypothetical protein